STRHRKVDRDQQRQVEDIEETNLDRDESLEKDRQQRRENSHRPAEAINLNLLARSRMCGHEFAHCCGASFEAALFGFVGTAGFGVVVVAAGVGLSGLDAFGAVAIGLPFASS